jgi:hypothetical protein
MPESRQHGKNMPESFSTHCEPAFESTMNGAEKCPKVAKSGKNMPESFKTHCEHTSESTISGADQVL